MDANSVIMLLVKSTMLLALAFAAIRWERSSSAIRRHSLWSATFVALLALPLLVVVLPGLHVPLPSWTTPSQVLHPDVPSEAALIDAGAESAVTSLPVGSPTIVNRQLSIVNRQSFTFDSPSRPQVLGALWLLGVTAALIALLRSLLRVRRLASSGTPVDDAAWRQAVERIARRLGLREMPQLIASNDVSAPMAGHAGRPVVFLPVDAVQWDAERRDVVLTHEMTHLLRRDPLRILAARVAGAIYWFHPLMWIAARRSTADCEQACDETVLALGIRPSTYARVLLDFAPYANARVPNVALPIVHRHRLETRVMAILSTSTAAARHAAPLRTGLTTLAAIAMLVTVAAARPASVQAEPEVARLAPIAVRTPAEGPTVAASGVREPIIPASTPVVTREPIIPASTPVVMQDGTCWNTSARSRSFSGSSQMEGSRVIQRVGRLGRERVAQMSFGDLRVCMITDGYDGSDVDEPGDWIGRADRIVLETERASDLRRLELDGGRSTYTVNGRSAPIDENVSAWRRSLLDLLDASWEMFNLRGRESSLRGDISSILGERSSLLGEISSLRGEVSSMQGEISSLRGEESSMRGEISSIRGHESSLRGEISSLRGEISSLESQRSDRYADRAAIDARINRARDAIRAVEDEIARYDADGRVRVVERRLAEFAVEQKVVVMVRRIRDFDIERRIADIDRQIANLNVDREIRGIEIEIRDLNVDSRVREISVRRDAALDRLRTILGR